MEWDSGVVSGVGIRASGVGSGVGSGNTGVGSGVGNRDISMVEPAPDS